MEIVKVTEISFWTPFFRWYNLARKDIVNSTSETYGGKSFAGF